MCKRVVSKRCKRSWCYTAPWRKIVRVRFALHLVCLLSPLTVSAQSSNSELGSLVSQNEPQSNGLRQEVNALRSALATALDQISALETQLADLRSNSVLALDGKMFLDSSTLTAVFSGVNVQVVNGAGQTESLNGLGNLIVGYNEQNPDNGDKTGSHNLVVGAAHSYSSFGGTVLGYRNTSSGPYANVTGGRDNLADGHHATVSGGFANEAVGVAPNFSKGPFGAPTVSGGFENVAMQQFPLIGAPSVSGGYRNVARLDAGEGGAPVVSGGSENSALGSCSSVTGGQQNQAGLGGDDRGLSCTSVLGGSSNIADGPTGVVVGGVKNRVTGQGAPVVVGGVNNLGEAQFSVVLGGRDQILVDPNGLAPTIPPIP